MPHCTVELIGMFSLSGKAGLVVGVANDRSIAWGCARAFHDAGGVHYIDGGYSITG